MLPVAVAWSSCDNNAIYYVPPVLPMVDDDTFSYNGAHIVDSLSSISDPSPLSIDIDSPAACSKRFDWVAWCAALLWGGG